MINHYESIGQHVVLFNGDGYDSSGIPLGNSINDGKLLTSGQGRDGFGLMPRRTSVWIINFTNEFYY